MVDPIRIAKLRIQPRLDDPPFATPPHYGAPNLGDNAPIPHIVPGLSLLEPFSPLNWRLPFRFRLAPPWRGDSCDNGSETPRSEYEQFAQMARWSEPSNESQQSWMSAVTRHMEDPSAGKTQIEKAFYAILKAFEDHKITYRFAPGVHMEQKIITPDLQSPDAVIGTKKGDCREVSLLAALTLHKLGFEDVYVLVTYEHVVPVVALTEKSYGRLEGVPLNTANSNIPGLFLYSFEATALPDRPGEYDLTRQSRSGRIFIEEAMTDPGAILLRIPSGKMVWRGGHTCPSTSSAE